MAVFSSMPGKHPSLLRFAVGIFVASTVTLPALAAPAPADLVIYGGTASGGCHRICGGKGGAPCRPA